MLALVCKKITPAFILVRTLENKIFSLRIYISLSLLGVGDKVVELSSRMVFFIKRECQETGKEISYRPLSGERERGFCSLTGPGSLDGFTTVLPFQIGSPREVT